MVTIAVAVLIEITLFRLHGSAPSGLSPLEFARRQDNLEFAIFAVSLLAGLTVWWASLRRVRQVAPAWHAGRLVILALGCAVALWPLVSFIGLLVSEDANQRTAFLLGVTVALILAAVALPIVAAWQWFGERKPTSE